MSQNFNRSGCYYAQRPSGGRRSRRGCRGRGAGALAGQPLKRAQSAHSPQMVRKTARDDRHQPGEYRPDLVVAGARLKLGGLGLVIYVFLGWNGDVATQSRSIRPLS